MLSSRPLRAQPTAGPVPASIREDTHDAPRTLHRIDPIGCGCTGCWSGFSQLFDEHGDTAQFHLLLHHEVTDCATGDRDDWMTVGLERCPQRFAEWIADQVRTGACSPGRCCNAKASPPVLGTLLDD